MPALARPADQPALEGRGLDNLVAFTRLLGYVRYFHPSDAAADTDWNAFAIHAVKKVEGAKSPEDLAKKLEDLFRPVAPTVQVFPTGKAPELPRALMASGDDPAIVAWHHLGVGMGGNPPSLYRSRRIDSKTPLLDSVANLTQEIEPKLVAGRKVRYRAWLRTEGFGQHGGAGLWTRGWNDDGDEMAMNMEDRPFRGTEWQEVELVGQLQEKVTSFYVGVALQGGGRAWVENAVLEAARPDGTWETIPLKNPGFDQEDPEKKGTPAGWDWSDRKKDHEIALVPNCREGGCVSLVGQEAVPLKLPPPAEAFETDLGGGVSCHVPLSLYRDGKGKTVPASPGWTPPAANGWQPSGNDRATRLADVALAWNVFQHFYPYFDVVQTDWPAALREALTSAATDRDELAFLDTLRVLVARLKDGHGNVGLMTQDWQKYAALPFALRWIEDRPPVIAVAAVVPGKADRIRPGDVILSLDGVPAAEALARRERLTSGATPQWIRWNAVNRLSRGLIGESARLRIQPAEGEPYEVSLPYEIKFPYPDEPRPEKVAEVRPGIWYVDIGLITDDDFNAAVAKLAEAKGVIFDLRGYPGKLSPVVLQHLTDTPITSARWNVPIVTRPDREGMEFQFSNWTLEPREPRIRGKVAFLTDGRAISYAETYMGMVEHYKLAEIVGGPTAGTNGNINPFELPGRYAFNWTGMKVLKHDGSQHHGIGILPTVPVTPTLKGVREGRDEVLEKGIETVSR